MLISVTKDTTVRLSPFVGLSFVAFRLMMDAAYYQIVVLKWNEIGFNWLYDPVREIVSLVLLFIFGALIRSRDLRPSDYFLSILILGIIVPAGTLFALNGGNTVYFIALNACLWVIWAFSRMPGVQFGIFKNGENLWITSAVIGLLLLHVILIVMGGWRYFNLDFTRIYSFREVVHQNILVGPVAYIYAWVGKIFSVFLILWSFHKKHYILGVMLIAGQIVLFGLTSHKAILFYPVLALATMFLYRRRVSPAVFGVGLAVIVLSTVVIFSVTDWLRPASWFVMRVFMLTALLHYDYYEFFSVNDFTYFSNSLLSGVFEYPYEDLIPNIIGQDMWGVGIPSFANTGFLATGYMHIGYLGMFLFSLILGAIFRLADSLIGRMKSPSVGVALFIIPVWQLRSADLPSVLLTHGMLLTLIGLWLLGKKKHTWRASGKKVSESRRSVTGIN